MIKNWDYLNEYHDDREAILRLVDRVFSSGWLILGSHVESFERNFSAYCGAACGIGVNSGTDALFLALKALGIREGDEVITVSNTAVPTVAAIRAAGGLPVFVDVEDDTFLMNVGQVEETISAKTKCILPVHLYGQAVDMQPLLEIAARKGIPVLEDCAQATGALYRGRKVGGFGDLAAFSFYPTKILGGFGDGGMVLTSSKALQDRIRRLRFYGMDDGYYSEEEGYNSRLDEVQAALLDFKLTNIDEAVRARQAIAARYSQELAGIGDIAVPTVRKDRTHQFYLYTIRTNARDRLVRFLRQCGVEARIHYATPIHLMRGYRILGYKQGDLPVTERLAGEIVSLPLFPGMHSSMVGTVIDAVRSFFGSP